MMYTAYMLSLMHCVSVGIVFNFNCKVFENQLKGL